jgi:hypothetical protein
LSKDWIEKTVLLGLFKPRQSLGLSNPSFLLTASGQRPVAKTPFPHWPIAIFLNTKDTLDV